MYFWNMVRMKAFLLLLNLFIKQSVKKHAIVYLVSHCHFLSEPYPCVSHVQELWQNWYLTWCLYSQACCVSLGESVISASCSGSAGMLKHKCFPVAWSLQIDVAAVQYLQKWPQTPVFLQSVCMQLGVGSSFEAVGVTGLCSRAELTDTEKGDGH